MPAPSNTALPSTAPEFNTVRYAAFARQLADNALAGKPTETILQQILLTRQIERNGKA